MARPKSKGAYVPLGAQYYLDDAILEAGPAAELMWVRTLSFLASVPTDGFLTDRQIRMVGIGLRDWKQRTDRLQEIGLLSVVDGGYVARNWSKWNRSTDEQNKQLAADRERKSRPKHDMSDADRQPLHSDRRQIDNRSIPVEADYATLQPDQEARKHAEVGHNSDRKMTPFRPDSSPQNRTEQNRTEQEKNSSSEVAIAPIRPDVLSLLDLLDSEIQGNGGKKPSRTKKNADAMRLMLDRDNHTPEQVASAIRWCQRDEFWRSNILSASKLREKYEQLRLAAQRTQPSRKQTPTERATQTLTLATEIDMKGIGS